MMQKGECMMKFCVVKDRSKAQHTFCKVKDDIQELNSAFLKDAERVLSELEADVCVYETENPEEADILIAYHNYKWV